MTPPDSRSTRPQTRDSYYGRPILKEPVWKPQIPFYLFTGGLAGASGVLSLAARISGDQRLARTSLYVGLAGELVSPALLVTDLGRPERFLNMLRVFKVTSPMNVGSWILFASGGATTTAAVCDKLARLPRAKRAAEVVSGVSGAPLAVYTATLLSDTAVPVWHEARRELPFVLRPGRPPPPAQPRRFCSHRKASRSSRRLAVAGALAGECMTFAMQRRLGFLAEPYRQAEAGTYKRLSSAATLAGAFVLARRGGRSRSAAVTGSALILGGELALRWSIFKAGLQSARDPDYTVRLQRQRLRQN